MKKFLSIFVALAMVCSLFAGTFAPRASAVVTSLTLDATKDAAKIVSASNPHYYYTGEPALPVNDNDFNATPIANGLYVYKMGDVIHANMTFDAVVPGRAFDFQLIAGNIITVIDHVTAYEVAGALSYPLQIGTGNVSYDGPYYLRVVEDVNGDGIYTDAAYWLNGNAPGTLTPIFIQYNLVWKTKIIKSCTGFNTIEGWITRGNGQTVEVPVIVGITYPDATIADDPIAAYYTVSAHSSGQFSLTFPVNPLTQIGDFNIFVRDTYMGGAYPPAAWIPGQELVTPSLAVPDNDYMIYDVITNAPDVSLTASTYYSPVLLYKGQTGQPLVLQLMNQNGGYVTGATWTIAYGGGAPAAIVPTAISPGFYRFLISPSASAVDVRFKASYNPYGTAITSNTVVINLRDLGPFNPFVDVNAVHNGAAVVGDGYATPTLDCLTGRYVYDKLPCTIGNGLEIAAGMWQVSDTDNWYIADTNLDSYWAPNGPVREIGVYTPDYTAAEWAGAQYVITESGKITVSVEATIWERANTVCDKWGSEKTGYTMDPTEMSQNACCHTYTKTFDICDVVSCSLTGVTLENGAQTDATTIEVGKKADLVVNVSGANAPAGLSCGCNTKIVHIYMVQNCAEVANAFTVDTYGGGTPVSVTDLWYNGIAGSALKRTPDATFSPDMYDISGLNVGLPDDGTVTFQNTTPGAIVIDNCEKLIFKGVTFNYNDDQAATACGYQLVVQVFALNRSFDSCSNMLVSYPFVSETLNDIAITPTVTTLSATGTVLEAGLDPEDILAGVPVIIESTQIGFSTTSSWKGVNWSAKLNGHSLSYYGITMTASAIDTGYRFTFSCAFPVAGDLVITGWQYGLYCNFKEIVTVTKKVVMPAFEVKIGLADGTMIANDHILTTGIGEKIYVTATDPRADGHHDFSTDLNWDLVVSEVINDCYLPTSIVCGTTPTGCTTPSPILVYGADNPNIEDAPQFELYFETYNCADLLVDTFTFADPTVKVNPTEVAFTIPASATHVTFTVKDAHAHGAPNVPVDINGSIMQWNPGFTAGASGYSFVAGEAITDNNGEADWAFVPPYSGKYTISVGSPEGSCLDLPCGWSDSLPSAELIAKYMSAVVDTTAPVVTLTAGLDGSTVSSATLNLTGKVTDNVGVTQLFVGFNKVDVLPDGSFMTALKLVAGENTITVVAYDAAGNKGTTTAKVTYTPAVNTSTVLVLTIGADIVSVNGKATSIDAAPEIVASRTFVPIRFISEAFGATVEWLPETQGITITLGDHTIGLQIGNSTAVIDGTIISLPAAPYIKNGRTMVPLRVISEAFGGDVVWDPTARTITITYTP